MLTPGRAATQIAIAAFFGGGGVAMMHEPARSEHRGAPVTLRAMPEHDLVGGQHGEQRVELGDVRHTGVEGAKVVVRARTDHATGLGELGGEIDDHLDVVRNLVRTQAARE